MEPRTWPRSIPAPDASNALRASNVSLECDRSLHSALCARCTVHGARSRQHLRPGVELGRQELADIEAVLTQPSRDQQRTAM
ncbi:hypothetical protein [Ferrimicrobium sp.]|uniref:hypothetical protein n=1 Tax=Ferrimicrobium sp. TaxID=2926050 RepID=UPI0026171EDC|nr:hypothetical protein [Ferrimicrobium sp.]